MNDRTISRTGNRRRHAGRAMTAWMPLGFVAGAACRKDITTLDAEKAGATADKTCAALTLAALAGPTGADLGASHG